MPRSATPNYSTYTTKQFPLIKEPFMRSNLSYDSLYENCYLEEVKNKELQQFDIAASKRDGTVLVETPTSEFRGLFFWQTYAIMLYVIGNKIYGASVPNTYGSSGWSPALLGTLTTSTGPVGFTEYLSSTGSVYVIWADGTKVGQFDSALTMTTYTDADIPSPHIPVPIYLDGYIFLIKSNSQDIYNSVLDTPSSWNNEFISVEMSADRLLTLARITNYILAFGDSSIEFFYDAQVASGSPLGRNDTLYRNIGYVGGLAQQGNKIYFIGRYASGDLDIFKIEDTKVTPIGSQQVKRWLNKNPNGANMYGALISFNSKTHYVFTVNSKTFAYDTVNDFYINWKFKSLDNFAIKYSTNGNNQSFNKCYIHVDDGTTYGVFSEFKPDTFTDNTSAFTMKIRTDNLYNDTLQAKFIARMSLFCDIGNTSATMQLRWSDDDYYTYSNPVPINLNQELPSVRRLGSYRRRAFELTNSENTPVRVWGYELDLNMGAS